MSVIDIRPGLRAFLLGDAAITAKVSNRIFDGQLPQGEKRTSIVFNQVSDIGDHHNGGPSGLARPRFQIDAWAQEIDAAAALSLLIKSRLDGYRGAFSWGSNSPQDSIIVRGVFFDTGRDLFDKASGLFAKSRDYIVWFSER